MNSELTLNLSDLETILTKSHCTCHIINPHKTRIILWKEVKDDQVTYYLRIGIQKFISYPLTDKNNELYWRFKVGEGKETLTTTNSELDSITKFNQRQEKAKDYDQSTNIEQSVNS